MAGRPVEAVRTVMEIREAAAAGEAVMKEMVAAAEAAVGTKKDVMDVQIKGIIVIKANADENTLARARRSRKNPSRAVHLAV